MKQGTIIGLWVGCLALLLIGAHAAHAGEILIVANPSVTVESLTKEVVADIYLNTKTRWDNDEKIRVVILKTGATHDLFIKEIVNTTAERLTTLWKKVVFTGTGTPPKIVKEEKDVIAFVAENPGAIGYIDAATPHDGVNVISLTE